MNIRHLKYADFDAISPVVDEWWGGRLVRGLLPRLFFEHFQPTSFAIEDITMTIGIGKPAWKGFSHACPSCHCVLSVEVNPLTIQGEILNALRKGH